VKWIVHFGMVWLTASCGAPESSARLQLSSPSCERAVVFFDLGDTVVDTFSHNFEKMHYMPEVYDYLLDLNAKAYPMGLIINVPESWGETQEEKITAIKEFTDQRWVDKNPMRWDFFDGLIFVNPTDKLRKPAPYLFDKALSKAQQMGCSAVFQGEDIWEVLEAERVGFYAYHIGQNGRAAYLPEPKIRTLIDTVSTGK
jgi:FMN phosphatase YigB (HAD superfamily)